VLQKNTLPPKDSNPLRIPQKILRIPPQAAQKAALTAENPPSDPHLAALIDAWPTLPDAIRAGILAMVRAAGR